MADEITPVPTAPSNPLDGLSAASIGKQTVIPSLPAPPTDPAQVKPFLDKIKEILEVYEGKRGNKFDSVITWRDLFDHGLVDVKLNGNTLTGKPDTPVFTPRGTSTDFAVPPAPTNVAASAGFNNVILTWDAPTFPSFAYAEVWRSDQNNIGLASLIGTTTANVYADSVGFTNITKYYWIRFVNKNDVKGPYHATSGVAASTSKVGNSDLYNEIITAEKLANAAVTSIKLEDGSIVTSKIANSAIVGEKLANLAVEAAKLANSSVTAEKIANLAVGTAAIQDGAINSAKIGTAAVGSAAIQDAAITNAKIGNLAVDDAKIASLDAAKINTGFLSANRIEAGTIDSKILQVDWAKIQNAYITWAMIRDVVVTNAQIANLDASKITSGQIDAARINTQGLNITSLQSSARMTVTNTVIKIYDDYYNLRVQIGDLNA